ncbi:MAG TPA: ester cyclase [Dehalococcoidia bacterium]|nr:ester cyclase [Dehalococcoidia bacterium]
MTHAVLHRWVAAGDAGDLDVFDDVLSPDVVVHAPLGLSTVGREAEKAVWRDAKAAIPDLRHDIREVFHDGETVIGRAVVTGTLVGEFAGLRGNGNRFEIDQVLIARIRDGKAYEVWEIADTGTLVRQVTGGASPSA